MDAQEIKMELQILFAGLMRGLTPIAEESFLRALKGQKYLREAIREAGRLQYKYPPYAPTPGDILSIAKRIQRHNDIPEISSDERVLIPENRREEIMKEIKSKLKEIGK